MAFSVRVGLAVAAATRPIRTLDDSFGFRGKSFEISEAGARQLFGIVFSRPPPLLERSLEQAPAFVRLVNMVVCGSVCAPSSIDSLPQQVFFRHFQPLRMRDRWQRLLLMEVSVLPRRELTFN